MLLWLPPGRAVGRLVIALRAACRIEEQDENKQARERCPDYVDRPVAPRSIPLPGSAHAPFADDQYQVDCEKDGARCGESERLQGAWIIGEALPVLRALASSGYTEGL